MHNLQFLPSKYMFHTAVVYFHPLLWANYCPVMGKLLQVPLTAEHYCNRDRILTSHYIHLTTRPRSWPPTTTTRDSSSSNIILLKADLSSHRGATIRSNRKTRTSRGGMAGSHSMAAARHRDIRRDSMATRRRKRYTYNSLRNNRAVEEGVWPAWRECACAVAPRKSASVCSDDEDEDICYL